MIKQHKTEVWLRGPVKDIPALLQPVAHALLQAREEVKEIVTDFPAAYLWQRPAGVASVGFHLQHLAGVLDRLFTYARGEGLNKAQLEWLSAEGKYVEGKNTLADLVNFFDEQIGTAIAQLSATNEQSLTEQRFVGRALMPSTVIGLLVHAAEHTMRHTGQLYVTAKIIKDSLNTGL